jgi:hypothetical protein
MTLGDLLDDTLIARMDDETFASYWSALGDVIRIACQARQAPPLAEVKQAEINTTSATTERAWSLTRQAPAAAFGFHPGASA